MNNPTSILASFSTMKNLVDTKQYQSQYDILAEFIQYIIIRNGLSFFTANQMKNYLHDVFGFDIPEAVVRTSTRKQQYITPKNYTYYVNRTELKDNSEFEKMKNVAEENNTNIIELLIDFAQKTDSTTNISKDALTQEFIAYLLDDQQITDSGKYNDIIGRFILTHENDEIIKTTLTAIREGSILYIGLNHNISETGSLKKNLTLFLGTEVLFSLYGYNGEIYQQLTQDLFAQIKIANQKNRRITLCYFSETKEEIDDYFTSAEHIVEGKLELLIDKPAMQSIINGCKTLSDVRIREADFFDKLKSSYGIIEDHRTTQYENSHNQDNLENSSENQQQYNSKKFISYIHKLRKGQPYTCELDAEYLVVTNAHLTLNASDEQVEQMKKELNVNSVCYAISVDRLTNMLWYKLGNGLGRKQYPNNVNVVLKARMLLTSKITQNIDKTYREIKAQFKEGKITEAQLASRIAFLKNKPITPEDLKSETIEDAINFSPESLAYYEEEIKRNKEALQKAKEQKEKDYLEISEKDRQIQNEQKRNAELEARLEEYKKKDEEKRNKCKKRKIMGLKVLCFIIVLSFVWGINICITKIFNKELFDAFALVINVFSIAIYLKIQNKILQVFKVEECTSKK